MAEQRGGMAGLVIAGASERTIWAEWLTLTLESYGYPDPIWYVNPKYREVLGRPCFPSIADLPEKPAIGVLVIGADVAMAECETLIGLGAEEVVVIAHGFAESGLPEGREREARLRGLAAGSPTRVIGPNCIGIARFHDRLCAIAQPVPPGIRAGDVSVISQSGGLSGGVLGALRGDGLGVDVCYSIGNGAAFSFEDALDWALRRPTTRTVCGVIESVREPDRLEALAAAARSDGKDIILLTLGTSSRGRSAALSHTGAVIGEQRVLGAFLDKIGVLRADTITELARLASLGRVVGRPVPGTGAFIITASGGGAALTADVAERNGVPLARLQLSTQARLREMIPPGPYIGNPLDVTAGNGPGGVAPVYDVVCAEPSVGMLVEPYVLPWPTRQAANRWHRSALERVADSAGARGKPLLVASVWEQPLSDWAAEFGSRPLVSMTSGLEETMRALGKLYRAAGPPAADAGDGTGINGMNVTHPPAVAPPAPASNPMAADGAAPPPRRVLGEAEGRGILASAGLRVPAGGVAADEDAAVALAASCHGPVVVKLGLPGVGHKERVGGVQVGVTGEGAVRSAYRAVADGAVRHGLASPAAVPVIVAEMVFGPELLVGATRDPVVGPSLTVAIGGWAAESGRVFGTVSLPLGGGSFGPVIAGWRLPRLLGDRRAGDLAAFLDTLAARFLSGPLAGFATVEVNPLILAADGAVAADVLLVR
jgi:acetate---CoA ligase (ADP-forming)